MECIRGKIDLSLLGREKSPALQPTIGKVETQSIFREFEVANPYNAFQLSRGGC
jgi:hypothetical protein